MSLEKLNVIYGGINVTDDMSYFYEKQVTGLAVKVITGSISIQASNDNFITKIFNETYTADELIEIDITAINWRMIGSGSFYIGSLVKIKRPIYPYKFFKVAEAGDRTTQGGKSFSRIHNIRKRGFLNWDLIEDIELPDWHNWFDGSTGFRDSFMIKEPLGGELILCTSVDNFPLQLDVYKYYSGSMELIENV